MKKITFILFALIAGTGFAQNAATETATVNAEIVEVITIESAGALNFGTFTTSETAEASVLLTADNTRSFSDTDMEIIAFGDHGVPTFTVTKGSTTTYGIALGVNTNPTLGGNSMILNALTHSLDTDGANTASSFTVGGTLNVPAGQGPGVYTGEVSVTVSYE